MLKVVIDTNVLLDGSTDDYNFGRRIIDEVIAGDVEAFANKATLAENKLLAKEKISDQGYLKRLDYYFGCLRLQEFGLRLNVVPEDAEDNKLVEAAVAAVAVVVVALAGRGLYLRVGRVWERYWAQQPKIHHATLSTAL